MKETLEGQGSLWPHRAGGQTKLCETLFNNLEKKKTCWTLVRNQLLLLVRTGLWLYSVTFLRCPSPSVYLSATPDGFTKERPLRFGSEYPTSGSHRTGHKMVTFADR